MKITHRRAHYDYTVLDKVEAGIVLTGPEVKSIIGSHASLEGSFVKIINSEVFLVGANISPYEFARVEDYDPKRTRKLLFHKKEIIKLKNKIEKSNLTLIPLSLYNKGPKIKLEVGLARGKKQHEKKEQKKREDVKRELGRDFRGKVK